jgi:hypothetical protein
MTDELGHSVISTRDNCNSSIRQRNSLMEDVNYAYGKIHIDMLQVKESNSNNNTVSKEVHYTCSVATMSGFSLIDEGPEELWGVSIGSAPLTASRRR